MVGEKLVNLPAWAGMLGKWCVLFNSVCYDKGLKFHTWFFACLSVLFQDPYKASPPRGFIIGGFSFCLQQYHIHMKACLSQPTLCLPLRETWIQIVSREIAGKYKAEYYKNM